MRLSPSEMDLTHAGILLQYRAALLRRIAKYYASPYYVAILFVRCVGSGKHLAMLEVPLVLALFFRTFETGRNPKKYLPRPVGLPKWAIASKTKKLMACSCLCACVCVGVCVGVYA